MEDHRDIEGKSSFTKALAAIGALLLALVITLTSCGNAVSTGDAGSGNNETVEAETDSDNAYEASSTSDMFTERDLSGDYDESSAVKIDLNGSSAKTSSNNAVSVDGGTVTIGKEGTYIVSGTLTDGQIIVNADDTAKVQIVLDNASITSKTSAAIYVKSADKVFITSATGTSNTLANGGSFTAIDDSNIDGAVFAKDDIVFNGSGTITVESPAGHGIVGKDDVKLTGGKLIINASRHGVQANDSIRVAEADIDIDAGKEGMEALLIYIQSGDMDIAAVDDGINAAEADNQTFDGGTAGSIEIAGGNIYITAGGDGIDANGSVTISGGYTVVCGPSQGDTSVLDYNSTATITGGTFIGTGGAGMAENFSSAENQGLIAVSVGNQSAGSSVSLKDSSGTTIAEVTPELGYAVVYVSTPDVQAGSTYTLSAGTYSESIELSENIYSTLNGGMRGFGGMNGDMGDRGSMGGDMRDRGNMNGDMEGRGSIDSDMHGAPNGDDVGRMRGPRGNFT